MRHGLYPIDVVWTGDKISQMTLVKTIKAMTIDEFQMLYS
jgi:hypothetical protein